MDSWMEELGIAWDEPDDWSDQAFYRPAGKGIVPAGTPAHQWINDREWEAYRAARARGLKAEEPATLLRPHAAANVALDKLEADRYRAISLMYAGLS